MIEIKNLFLKYVREYYALYDINLNIEKGECVALVGSEGSGKTTLLRVLCNLEKFDKGEVYIKDISVKKIDFKTDVNLGYVPVKPVFFEKKTVEENLKYVLESRKLSSTEIENKINSCLIEFNLEKYKLSKVSDLTLFEKYVISLARLSLREMEIVLIDDIFNGLKQEEQKELVNLINHIFVSKNITTVIGVSDVDILEQMPNRVVKFDNGSIVKE